MSRRIKASDQDRTAKYRISVAAHMTGISVHSLRNWERRFKIVAPGRTRADDRLYSEADIARLKQIKLLLDRGHPISSLARMDSVSILRLIDDEAVRPDATGSQLPVSSLNRMFTAAIVENNLDRARSLLSRGAAVLPPWELIQEVLIPLAGQLRDEREAGRLRPLHWNLAESELRSIAISMFRLHNPPARHDAPVGLVTVVTPDDDELYVQLVSTLGALHGWRMLPAGRSLGIREIAFAIGEYQPDALIITADRPSPDTLFNELSQLRRAVPKTVGIIAAGPGSGMVKPPSGTSTIPDLNDLALWLKRYNGSRRNRDI